MPGEQATTNSSGTMPRRRTFSRTRPSAAWGTRVHSEFERQVLALGRSDLHPEVSYLHGQVVTRGAKGSVRLDVVVGSPSSPTAIYDLKTGTQGLTPARIREIQSHLPSGFQDIPVLEVRP